MNIVFFWEIVPTGLILVLFWKIRTKAQAPTQPPYVQSVEIQDPVDALLSTNPTPGAYRGTLQRDEAGGGSGFVGVSRVFQNPRRYDSDDEQGPSARTPTIPSFLGASPRVGSFPTSGSLTRVGSSFSPYNTDSPLNKDREDQPGGEKESLPASALQDRPRRPLVARPLGSLNQ